jgi:hypothetical protein
MFDCEVHMSQHEFTLVCADFLRMPFDTSLQQPVTAA